MSEPVINSIDNRGVAPYRLLDAWRGIAALWVVMLHCCIAAVADGWPHLASEPFYAFCLRGQLGVYMFFIISGYCITAAAVSALKKPQSVWYFLRARVRRIYPPYIASSVVAVCFYLLCSFLAAHHLMPKVNHPLPFRGEHFLFYFAALTMTQVPLHTKMILVVYWTLCYEVTFYAIVAVCLATLGRKSKTVLFSGLNVLTVASLIWLVVSPSTCPFPLNLWYQFGLGALVFMLINHSQERSVKFYFGAAVVLICLFAYFHQGPHFMGHPSTRIQAMFGVGFALGLLGLYRFDAVLSRIRGIQMVQWIGAISYSLYLSHFFIIPIPQQAAKRLGFVDGTYWVSVLAQIAVAIAGAFIFHILFERPFLSPQARGREEKILSDRTSGYESGLEERTAPSVPVAEPHQSPPATTI